MGNCMETFSRARRMAPEEAGDCTGSPTASEGLDESPRGFQEGKEGGLQVKILLTRAEVEWLMLQLEGNGNVKMRRSLEEAIAEIVRRRQQRKERDVDEEGGGWKPTLESIMECPESQSFDGRS